MVFFPCSCFSFSSILADVHLLRFMGFRAVFFSHVFLMYKYVWREIVWVQTQLSAFSSMYGDCIFACADSFPHKQMGYRKFSSSLTCVLFWSPSHKHRLPLKPAKSSTDKKEKKSWTRWVRGQLPMPLWVICLGLRSEAKSHLPLGWRNRLFLTMAGLTTMSLTLPATRRLLLSLLSTTSLFHLRLGFLLSVSWAIELFGELGSSSLLSPWSFCESISNEFPAAR